MMSAKFLRIAVLAVRRHVSSRWLLAILAPKELQNVLVG
jgi:hypothetical protein